MTDAGATMGWPARRQPRVPSTPTAAFAYDAVGNQTSMTDGAGTETRISPALNRLTAVTRGTDAFAYGYRTALSSMEAPLLMYWDRIPADAAGELST